MMKFKIDEHSIPRYQTFGIVGLVLILLLGIVSYFLTKNHYANQARIQELYDQIMQQKLNATENELNATLDYISFKHAQAESILKTESKTQVDQAFAVAQGIYQQELGKRPLGEIKNLIRESLRNVRFFADRGYIFIIDTDGQGVLSPTTPEVEGQSLYDLQDDTGHYVNREFIRLVAKSPTQSGYSSYRWYHPGSREMSNKVSYLRLFEPFGWIIGAGDYVEEFQNGLKAAVLTRIEALRFGQNGYIAVIRTDGKVVSSPGWSVSQYTESDEEALKIEEQALQSILKAGRQGQGIARYHWYYPDGRGPVEKVSWIKKVPGWDWLLVAGVYPEDIDKLLEKQRNRLVDAQVSDTQALVYALSIAVILSLMLALWFSKMLKRLFRLYQLDIDQKQQELTDNAKELMVAASVFQNSSEGIIIADLQNKIIAVNEAFTQITGYSEEDVVGQNPAILASGKHDKRFYDEMWKALKTVGRWRGEIWNRRKDGVIFPEWQSIIVSRDGDGEISHYISTLSDISERKEAEQRLRYLADYDPLTDLPNRRLLNRRVDKAIRIASRLRHKNKKKYKKLALFFIDLDRFKNVNDSLGHAAGDQVLVQVAKRLSSIVRPDDTVSRLGGDEFVILMADVHLPDVAATLSARILDIIAEPMDVDGRALVLTPSIGISVFPYDGIDFDTLSRNADAALYHAKDLGRNNYQFYTEEMNQQVSQRLEMENGLRRAIVEGEFQLHYQPQFRLDDNSLCGCEALIRWYSPEGGYQRPDEFIPLAEETGLIEPIGNWVMLTACEQGARWIEAGFTQINMAVNVSAYQFRESLTDTVQQILEDTGFPAKQLTLEITESILMSSADQAVGLLSELKHLGVGIALDDFGTGYCSLAYLKKFPLDKLKIDRTFISGVPEDRDDCAITSSIVDIARNLELDTVAEGIETVAQRDYLISEGCDQVQGYYFARPLPEGEFMNLITSELDKV